MNNLHLNFLREDSGNTVTRMFKLILSNPSDHESYYSQGELFYSAAIDQVFSERASVEMINRQIRVLDSFETANIHRRHGIASSIGGFTERMHATLWTEPMLDRVFAEGIAAHIFLWRKQAQLLTWNEPEKRSFPGTD
jgi:hypothetical protein